MIDGETGVLFGDTTVESLAAALTRAAAHDLGRRADPRATPNGSRERASSSEIQHIVDDTLSAPAGSRW